MAIRYVLVVPSGHSVADGEGALIHVHVLPFQGAHFAAAQAAESAEAYHHFTDGNSVGACGFQKLLHLLHGGHVGLIFYRGRRRHRIAGVYDDELPFHRRLEGQPQDSVF